MRDGMCEGVFDPLETTHYSLHAVVGTLDAEFHYITSLEDDGI
jgi:hypothetical protein